MMKQRTEERLLTPHLTSQPELGEVKIWGGGRTDWGLKSSRVKSSQRSETGDGRDGAPTSADIQLGGDFQPGATARTEPDK